MIIDIFKLILEFSGAFLKFLLTTKEGEKLFSASIIMTFLLGYLAYNK